MIYKQKKIFFKKRALSQLISANSLYNCTTILDYIRQKSVNFPKSLKEKHNLKQN